METAASTENKWTAKERRIIREFVAVVRKASRNASRKIILYGSRARGDADEDSDDDFLLLLDDVTEKDKKALNRCQYQIYRDI